MTAPRIATIARIDRTAPKARPGIGMAAIAGARWYGHGAAHRRRRTG